LILKKWSKFILPSILIALVVLVFAKPVSATNGLPLPPGVSKPVFTLEKVPASITPSSIFQVEVWIRGIPDGYDLESFECQVWFDATLVERVDIETIPKSGFAISAFPPDMFRVFISASWVSGNPEFGEDAVWAIITLHCLDVGKSMITVEAQDESSDSYTIYLTDGAQTYHVDPPPYSVPCNQRYPQSVGGIMTGVNKLSVLAPYIALVGLIGVVSSIFVIVKKRRA
jgi:hypothetical protein